MSEILEQLLTYWQDPANTLDPSATLRAGSLTLIEVYPAPDEGPSSATASGVNGI